ncbi:MAG: pyridoxamine 5'-phosphate oxidase, partial [Myxococcales bacterium]|nr:pyridoxamine 5'-phosphate oxidase [Myxococcales bacterium]
HPQTRAGNPELLERRAEPTAGADPLQLFSAWYTLARAGGDRADAAALATYGENGPAVRMVLVKSCVHGQFRIFTNYQSRKARELEATGRAALVFHWPSIEAQVRIQGGVERLSAEASDDYFAARPRGSQLGALLSPQSERIQSFAELEAQREAQLAALGNQPIARPEHWGGYGLTPDLIEFWCEGENRLHRRYEYQRSAAGWRFSLLAP